MIWFIWKNKNSIFISGASEIVYVFFRDKYCSAEAFNHLCESRPSQDTLVRDIGFLPNDNHL